MRGGNPVRVIEDCLNGRRTVWDDPFKPGRNGLAGIEQRIEVNSPLALVDPHARHERFSIGASAQRLALGAGDRVAGARDPPCADRAGHAGAADPDRGAAAKRTPAGNGGQVRRRAREVRKDSGGLRSDRGELAARSSTPGDIIKVSRIDGVHLDADQHEILGKGPG